MGVVGVGTWIGFPAGSIREIWDWIMMAVGAAFVVPNVLRWYWWRLNGWGYAAGTAVGMLAALALPFSMKMAPIWFPTGEGMEPTWQMQLAYTLNRPFVAFPVVASLSLIGCLAGTWLTRPTDETILVSFFRRVRPFGLWRPIRRRSGLSAEQLDDPSESMTLALLNVVLASIVILGAYLAPMYLVGHWHAHALWWLGTAIAGAAVLYFTWYRKLPPADSETKGGS